MKLINYFLLTILFVSQILGNQPKWLIEIKQIKILASTRNDIFKLLGQPEKFSDYGEYFNLKDARISVSYSIGSCVNGWNIKKGIIFQIAVFPLKPINPILIGLNLKKFKSYKESDTTNIIYYNDYLVCDLFSQ